jgi:multidrug resistance efflux pump
MRLKWPLLAGLIVLLAVIGALIATVRIHYLQSKPKAAIAAARQARPTEVTLDAAIEPRNVVTIAAPAEGIIVRFLADTGQEVYQGQLLAQIRNPKLESIAQQAAEAAEAAEARVADVQNSLIAERLEASRAHADETRTKAELERAQRFYKQQKELIAQGATPRLTYEKAEQDYNTYKSDANNLARAAEDADKQITELTKELEEVRKTAAAKTESSDDAKTAAAAAQEVRSTVDGVVVARHGQPGRLAREAKPNLFEIGVNLTELQLQLSLDAKTIARVRPGQAASIELTGAPAAMIGTVREAGNGKAIIDFTAPPTGAKPGQIAKVKLRLT